MLTRQQFKLINFIHEKISDQGVSPSFEEMRDALKLKSKSGIHRLIQSLEERGYLRRIPNRARALEVLRMPNTSEPDQKIKISNTPNWAESIKINQNTRIHLSDVDDDDDDHDSTIKLPLYGSIAAGTPIEALQQDGSFISIPRKMLGFGEYYCLKVQGDSMIEACIMDEDIIIVEKCDTVENGTIAVVLIDNQEVTLKRITAKQENILLKAENRHYKEKEFSHGRIKIQGRLAGLYRKY